MSSNFFAQQDLARRNTRVLVALFSLAVLLLLLLTNIVALVSLGFIDPSFFSGPRNWQNLPWHLVAWVSLAVLAAVAIAVLIKWQQLKAGGKVVAESLGGVRLSPDSKEPLQRRLLNVVEEMALAANTPVPAVYLLPERGINAFAAGYSPADAVIGVTQGCLEQLNRDELQGVVAHEFSHILNGDMRMNIRLIAILNGILFLGHIGYYMLRAGSRGSAIRAGTSRNNKQNASGLLFLALGLVVIGYMGSFFGNLIKAAVSRQREFLADASAVQFTRNPRGIAGALKAIGSHSSSSQIRSQNADENSHLFFGEAISRWASIFATHPPLATRIKRLEPHWNGKFPTPRSAQTATEATTDSEAAPAKPTNAERLQQALPLLLLHSSRQTEPATALVCCLLLQQDDSVRSQQLHLIKEMGSAALLQQVDQLCDAVAMLNEVQQVQLLQRLMPALKSLSEARFVQFAQLLQALLQAIPDAGLTPWLVSQFVEHSVAVQYDQTQIVRKTSAKPLAQLQAQVLPLLALISSVAGSAAQQQQAWQAALAQLALSADTAKPAIDLAALSRHLPLLLAASPLVKQQLWQAIEACVRADQLIVQQEKALLLALALLLEIPYPADADN
ncbi:M48 family metallopeptidase [Rheinheimera sp.]|uniref:M48 family metallopeptidase n=1 Tax=Rheinheimera sp. TaxID=1869214 RepID=UPI0027352FCE|nr:M48 family metallopeptidase [Rheinheimera sp.]MDP2714817.1 M48 family metallopeptidase [Rheinheimera sp.]